MFEPNSGGRTHCGSSPSSPFSLPPSRTRSSSKLSSWGRERRRRARVPRRRRRRRMATTRRVSGLTRARSSWAARGADRGVRGIGAEFEASESRSVKGERERDQKETCRTFSALRLRRSRVLMGSVPLVVGGFSKLFLKAGCREVRVAGLPEFLDKLNKDRGVLTSGVHLS